MRILLFFFQNTFLMIQVNFFGRGVEVMLENLDFQVAMLVYWSVPALPADPSSPLARIREDPNV